MPITIPLNLPTFRQFQYNDITLVGTGDSTIDDAAIDAALSVLNVLGVNATLWLTGTFNINSSHSLNGNVSLRGLTPDTELVIENEDNSFMAFKWNSTFHPTTATQYAVSTSKAFSETITSAAHEPAKGSWILTWSEDTIADATPHTSTTQQRPAEMHQVSYFDKVTNLIWVADGFVVDQLTTTPKMVVLTMNKNVIVDNFRVRHSARSGEYATLFYFQCIDGLVVENIQADRLGPGCIWFTYCSNVEVQGIKWGGSERLDLNYCVVVGVVNNFTFCDSHVMGTRHPFTTSSAWTGVTPTRRYGTPLNVVVDNVTVNCYSKRDLDSGLVYYRSGTGTQPSVGNAVTGTVSGASGTLESISLAAGTWGGTAQGWMRIGSITGQFVQSDTFTFPAATTTTAVLSRNALDTHSEGYGIRFQNCHISVAGDWNANTAFTIRSRKTEIVNCHILGGGSTANYAGGVSNQAKGTRISNCTFQGLQWGVLNQITNGWTDDAEIVACKFQDIRGPAIVVYEGDNLRIRKNEFDSCASSNTSPWNKSVIQFLVESSGNRIMQNEIPKGSNDYSVGLYTTMVADDLLAIGNIVDGYGSGVFGFGGTDAANAETAHAANNYTDA